MWSVPRAHVGQRLVGEVVVADARRRGRAPAGPRRRGSTATRSGRSRTTEPSSRQVAAHPRDVVAADRAAGDDPEAVLAQARDRQVAHDPAARREHRGVDDRRPTGRSTSLAARRCRKASAPGPADLDLGERREVEEPDPLAAGAVLGLRRSATSRAPPTRRAGSTSSPVSSSRVGLVPLRALPAGALEEVRAEARLALVERRRAQRRAPARSAGAGAGRRRPRGSPARRAART